ncbi:hypothetical protein, partial [Ferrimicrobium acidiphilum]|uniref:hypothetical protein n=1 Tax=Ferrimicrobium acidiphilum TaxID=121039 RepID=UPI0023F404C5
WHPLRTRSLASNPFILYARDRSALDADPLPYSPACCRDSIVFRPQWLTTGRTGSPRIITALPTSCSRASIAWPVSAAIAILFHPQS